MSTILSDVTPTELNRDDAAAAFLERWKDPTEVSKDVKGAKEDDDETIVDPPEDQETDDTQDPEDPKDPDESVDPEDTPEPKARKVAEDDAEISYTVDGVEHKASVKELKRLAGQEAALTRKSQEVAEKTKRTDELGTHHFNALAVLQQRAEDEYKPYANIDMLVASRDMDPEEFAAVRAEQARTYENYKFFSNELEGLVQHNSQQAQERFQTEATEAIKVLSDPVKGIPGYNEAMYNEICDFAKAQGMSPQRVYGITDPIAIKLLHMAMAQSKVQKVSTVKKAGSAKQPLKSSGINPSEKAAPSVKSAMAKLKNSGNREDAANLFMTRWKVED